MGSCTWGVGLDNSAAVFAKMIRSVALISWVIVRLGECSPVSFNLSPPLSKHSVNVDLIADDIMSRADTLESANKDTAKEIDSYKNLISEKSDLIDQQTSALSEKMEELESELMEKLTGLEERLKDKEEEERKLKETMDKLGLKDTDNLENIQPADQSESISQWPMGDSNHENINSEKRSGIVGGQDGGSEKVMESHPGVVAFKMLPFIKLTNVQHPAPITSLGPQTM